MVDIYSRIKSLYLWIVSRDQGDLLALVEAHNCISRLCKVRTKALQYIAGEAAMTSEPVPLGNFLFALTLYFSSSGSLVHGGHALDSADLELVENTARACLSRLSPLWGRGPHILSDIIRNPGHFGNTPLSYRHVF